MISTVHCLNVLLKWENVSIVTSCDACHEQVFMQLWSHRQLTSVEEKAWDSDSHTLGGRHRKGSGENA